MYVPDNYSRHANGVGEQLPLASSTYTQSDHRSSYQALRRSGSYLRERKDSSDASGGTSLSERLRRIYSAIKEFFIRSYRNFWDQLTEVSWQEASLLLLSLLMLIVGTATERVTFKMMVDRMLPYKFVLLQIIYLLSATGFGLVTYLKMKVLKVDEFNAGMQDFPLIDVVIMAVIDTVPFIIMTFTASQVYATSTVILMHTSTIFVVFGSKLTFPHRQYTKLNIIGVVLIAMSVIICLLKVILQQWHFRWELKAEGRTTTHHVILDTFLYTFAAAMHGLGTIFKEKSIIRWSQPIDNFFLSAWLFFFQFLIMLLFSVLYCLGRAAIGYIDLSIAFSNMYFGWLCFLGRDSPDQYDDDDSNFIDCSQSMGLIFGFVLSNVLVMISMSGVLRMKSQILGRSTAFAIFAAFLVLWWYDVAVTESRSWMGGREGPMDILAIIVLIVGMEVYDKEPEPDVELITNQAAAAISYQNYPPDSIGPGIAIG